MTAATPSKIIDLHTHLFNARCLPMAGIIANLLNEDAGDSGFSRAMAKLINAICQDEDSTSALFLTDNSTHDFAVFYVSKTPRIANKIGPDQDFNKGNCLASRLFVMNVAPEFSGRQA